MKRRVLKKKVSRLQKQVCKLKAEIEVKRKMLASKNKQ
jgi:hypothetical protein